MLTGRTWELWREQFDIQVGGASQKGCGPVDGWSYANFAPLFNKTTTAPGTSIVSAGTTVCIKYYHVVIIIRLRIKNGQSLSDLWASKTDNVEDRRDETLLLFYGESQQGC